MEVKKPMLEGTGSADFAAVSTESDHNLII